MVYICRKEHFCAAHKLVNPAWTKEKNERVFGACANQNWHGHNFTLIVKVKGKPAVDTSFVMDMKVLGQLIREEIIEKVDHKNFNEDVDFLKGKMPTCEIIIMEFWKILAPKIAKISKQTAQLHCLELHETENNFVEYFGEE